MLRSASCILVTGGCGFVGSALVAELLQQSSARIVVLDNLFNGRRAFLPESPRVEFHHADLTDAQAMTQIVQDARPDMVFHLAALHYIPYCNAHPGETMHVNVVGTQHVLEACRVTAPAVVVLISSAAVYPIADDPLTEEGPVGPTDIYGLSKWVNEQQLALYAQQTSSRCAAARLFNVFGPNETNPHVIPEILTQIMAERGPLALGNIKPKRDFIYVTDVARALLAIAEHLDTSFRVYNVGTGAEHSVEEIVGHLGVLTGQTLEIAVAADRVRPSDRLHLVSDTRRLREETGWQPHYTLQTGLKELVSFSHKAL